MRTLFIISLIFLSFKTSFSQVNDEISVRKILSAQEAAWNSGSVENFMKGYWKNDSLMFIGKSGITYGWQQALENYKKHYPDTAAMGKLIFNILEVKSLSPGYYFLVGKWHLKRTAGDIEGHFTLLFKKFADQWFIITDHTS